jgi:hypothetical protein
MINGKRHYLWRAVDQEGNMLDILAQRWTGMLTVPARPKSVHTRLAQLGSPRCRPN